MIGALAANNNNNNKNLTKQFKLWRLIDFSKLAETDNEAQRCPDNFGRIMIFYNAQGQITMEQMAAGEDARRDSLRNKDKHKDNDGNEDNNDDGMDDGTSTVGSLL